PGRADGAAVGPAVFGCRHGALHSADLGAQGEHLDIVGGFCPPVQLRPAPRWGDRGAPAGEISLDRTAPCKPPRHNRARRVSAALVTGRARSRAPWLSPPMRPTRSEWPGLWLGLPM